MWGQKKESTSVQELWRSQEVSFSKPIIWPALWSSAGWQFLPLYFLLPFSLRWILSLMWYQPFSKDDCLQHSLYILYLPILPLLCFYLIQFSVTLIIRDTFLKHHSDRKVSHGAVISYFSAPCYWTFALNFWTFSVRIQTLLALQYLHVHNYYIKGTWFHTLFDPEVERMIQFLSLKSFNYLKGKVGDFFYPLLVHSPHGCSSWGWVRQNLGAQSCIKSPMWVQKPTWTIICSFPGSLAKSWIRSGAAGLHLVLCDTVLTSQVAT